MPAISAANLVQLLADKIPARLLSPHLNPVLEGVTDFSAPRNGHLAFIKNNNSGLAPHTAIVIPETFNLDCMDAKERDDICFIVCSAPAVFFAYATQYFTQSVVPEGGIHHPKAHIADSAIIGKRVIIDAGVVVGEGVKIGDGTHLYPNVVIYDHCVIGKEVIIHAGAVIGADGFGFPHHRGKWVKQPHIGRVVIGDHVEIGANSTIDRGTLGDTTIGEGVKLDNQIHIGHNCHIGEHTVMAAGGVVGGSTTIGAHCLVGGAVAIADHRRVVAGTSITGLGAVISDINEAGHYTALFPMLKHQEWKRLAVQIKRLNKPRKNTATRIDAGDATTAL